MPRVPNPMSTPVMLLIEMLLPVRSRTKVAVWFAKGNFVPLVIDPPAFEYLPLEFGAPIIPSVAWPLPIVVSVSVESAVAAVQ